jgi:ornithine cyclodeaminase
MTVILHDPEIAPLLDMNALIPVMEDFLRAGADGRTVAPPRHAVNFFDSGQLVFTIGGFDRAGHSLAGFRVYDTFASANPDISLQLVAVWNSETGALLGVLLGRLIGEWRTGALGGVAIRYMARPDAKTCAVIGSGKQARTQLLATMASRNILETRVFSRDATKCAQFAEALSRETGARVYSTGSPREAVEGADIVLCATNSPPAVFETAWLSPRAHVSSVGPKLRTAHELPLDIADRVTFLASDSPKQMSAYREPHMISDYPIFGRMTDLADIVAGKITRPIGDGVTLYCSTGLAGTEVAAAAHIIERYRLNLTSSN